MAKQLIADGLAADTPAAAIENAGAPTARLVQAPLDGLASVLGDMDAQGPVLILIGEVAARGAHDLAAALPGAKRSSRTGTRPCL